MDPSPYSTRISSVQKSKTPNLFSLSSVNSKSFSQSYAKQSKIKPLGDLISMRQNHHKINSTKIPNKNHTILTKQISLNLQTFQSVQTSNKTSKKKSNSKTKLYLSIKKSNQKYQTPVETKNSIHNLYIGLKKQKITLLGKIQTLKDSFFGSAESIKKQNLNKNKYIIKQNQNQDQQVPFKLEESPDSGIQKLMLDKLNGKNYIFGLRKIKTTRQIIQMKGNINEKQKIKIKLENKTKNHAFRA